MLKNEYFLEKKASKNRRRIEGPQTPVGLEPAAGTLPDAVLLLTYTVTNFL